MSYSIERYNLRHSTDRLPEAPVYYETWGEALRGLLRGTGNAIRNFPFARSVEVLGNAIFFLFKWTCYAGFAVWMLASFGPLLSLFMVGIGLLVGRLFTALDIYIDKNQ